MALEPNENLHKSIEKFESMLKTDDVYFFDSEDFEVIIHHYLNEGNIGLGKKAIQLGLQQHPDATELKLLHAEVLVFEDKFDDAEKLLDELQDIDYLNEEIYIQRANIHSKKDEHVKAIELLSKALEFTDSGFDIHSLLGMEYLFMDDYENAKQSFMKCVDIDDSDYSSLYNVVYCFEFLEDFEGAIHSLNDYLERKPYCQVAWHQLGKMYLAKKMLAEALTAFDFAIISDDGFIGAYFEKGKVLEKLGRYNEAVENYEVTIEIDDPTSHAYLRIGKCHEKLGNLELARHYFYNTVHEDPLLDKGWLAITDFYFRQQDFKKALHYINKAINIDGENPLYWKRCAKIYMGLKNWDEADFAFKQAVELGNYELDSWLQWANVLLKIKDYESATQVLLQGLEFYPENADLHYKIAGTYLKAQKTYKARKELKTALQLDAKKKKLFQKEFPEFSTLKWVVDSFSRSKKPQT